MPGMTCSAHRYVQLDDDVVHKALWHRRRVWAVCCGILSTGAVFTICKIAPGKDQSGVDDLANILVRQGSVRQGMQLPAHMPMQPARAQQFPQTARVWPTTAWQFMQPARTQHIVQPVWAATTDNAIPAVSVDASPQPKETVLNALKAGSDDEVRAALVTALPALEASNPTTDPAFSDKLPGKWEVRYSGSVAPGPVDSPTREIALLMYAQGFGPGNAALTLSKRLPDSLVQVKTVSLEITRQSGEAFGDSRARLALRLLDGQRDVDIDLVCDLMASGPGKLNERGKEVSIDGGAPVSIPEQVRYSRDLFITYLDDNLLIARDATGSPDILVRETQPAVDTSVPEQPDAQ